MQLFGIRSRTNARAESVGRDASDELRRRMARPQRHRLLSGYPMGPLMRPADYWMPWREIEADLSRELIVGVLPHASCNPRVPGCGFCTFPHEPFHNDAVRRVAAAVAREIETTPERDPSSAGRRVTAVYLGGATANLTPPAELAAIVSRLEETFDLAEAEVTLEGVPRYFLTRGESALDLLARMRIRQPRISMGVQTFDRAWLERMGRLGFGDGDLFLAVVGAARRRGFTTSVDLLFNLPGAPPALALDDARRAVDLGVDQICVYNLVLTAELGTEWSRDAALVAAMPDVERAHDLWLAVREHLLAQGYVPSTLTNFERADVVDTERAFAYERASFRPDAFDALGFGPAAISTRTSRDRRALKWANHESSARYLERMELDIEPVASGFVYAPVDLKLMHLTRSLSLGAIDRARYRAFFDTDPVDDFPEAFAACEGAGLLSINGANVTLTPSGAFYADAVAGVLAAPRTRALRASDEGAIQLHMG